MEAKEMNIFQKMEAITNELGFVAKNLNVAVSKTNSYKATGEVDVLEAVKPLENKYGIYSYASNREIIESDTLTQNTQYGEKNSLFLRMKVTYRFVNTDNPQEYIETVSFAEGIDSGDKASGKAMTYADKYALMKAYKISTGEDPDQKASEEYGKKGGNPIAKPITKKQFDSIKNYMSIYGDKLKPFYPDYIKGKQLSDLTYQQANNFIGLIESSKHTIEGM